VNFPFCFLFCVLDELFLIPRGALLPFSSDVPYKFNGVESFYVVSMEYFFYIGHPKDSEGSPHLSGAPLPYSTTLTQASSQLISLASSFVSFYITFNSSYYILSQLFALLYP
jgi:hypothetical protein